MSTRALYRVNFAEQMQAPRRRPVPRAVSSVLFLVLIAATACGERGNDSLTAPGFDPLRRFAITASVDADPLVPADPFNKPAIGTRFVATRLTIRNSSSRELTVEPARWIKAVTTNGAAVDAAVITAQPDDISAGGSARGVMAPGAEISGLLFYEIPGGDGIAFLKYEDDLDPRQAGRIDIA